MSSGTARDMRDAFRIGALSGVILFVAGGVQALVVALDQLHGTFGTIIALLFWPAVMLAMVPPVLLGHRLADASKGLSVLLAGALAGFIVGVAYLVADVLLLLALRQSPLSSNPAMVPSTDVVLFVAFLVVAILAGALLTLSGAAVAGARRRKPAAAH